MKIRKKRVFRWRQRASERFEAKEERQKPSHALSNSRKFCQFLNCFYFSLQNSCTVIAEFLILAKSLICRKNVRGFQKKIKRTEFASLTSQLLVLLQTASGFILHCLNPYLLSVGLPSPCKRLKKGINKKVFNTMTS